MQSGGKVCIYAKPEPLFVKLTKLQTLFAKPLEGYFLLFFANRTMQSLFAKPLEMLLLHENRRRRNKGSTIPSVTALVVILYTLSSVFH